MIVTPLIGSLILFRMIDGASRWERVRYVIVPHLMPLVIFIMLMQLRDGLRVFEPIVGFSVEANAMSLSYIIHSDLRGGGDSRLFGSASMTSVRRSSAWRSC